MGVLRAGQARKGLLLSLPAPAQLYLNIWPFGRCKENRITAPIGDLPWDSAPFVGALQLPGLCLRNKTLACFFCPWSPGQFLVSAPQVWQRSSWMGALTGSVEHCEILWELAAVGSRLIPSLSTSGQLWPHRLPSPGLGDPSRTRGLRQFWD